MNNSASAEPKPYPSTLGQRLNFQPLEVTRRLWAEMGSSPLRWRRAARIALITAVGAGVTAALQISNALGLTLLFNMAAPELALSLRASAQFLIGAAICQTAGLALAGAMADSPLPHLSLFFVLSLISGYLIYGDARIGRIWIWVQVPVLTAFYLVLFDPGGFGWNDAQAWAGVAVAVAILYIANTLLWPKPPAEVLGQSLSETVERSRRRLRLLVDIWVGNGFEHDRPVASKLGYHLTLLGPAAHRGGIETSALLLSAVTVAERIHNEIERIADVVTHADGLVLDASVRDRAINQWRELDAALESYAAMLADAADASRSAPAEIAARHDPGVPGAGAILARFDSIATLLQSDPAELPQPAQLDAESAREEQTARRVLEAPRLNRFLLRYTVRHTVAMALAFVSGLFVNNAAMHAALWLLMIGGPPSHGATVRKFTVRAIGAAAALVLTAVGMALLAPNGTTLFSYMLAIFAGALLMAYIGQGGGLLSYLSIGGTAFVIAFSGPGPRNDAFASIWTIWGISFGMLIRAVVSMFWREWPRRTLVEEFQPPVQALMLLADAAHHRSDWNAGEIRQAQRALIDGIREMLAVAGDAQLEGRGAGIDAANLVDALDTLRRVGFILGNLALSPRGEPHAIDESFHAALHARFAAWLEALRAEQAAGVPSLAPLREMVRNCIAPDLKPWASATGVQLRLLDAVRQLEKQLCTVSIY